jgi:2-C-methyl-D-erythritol 4-phosphate cytidylyltransferase
VSRESDDSLTAVVVAAGSGQRFGGDKLFAQLSGSPVLAWSLDELARCPSVRSIVLVLSEENARRGQALVRRLGLERVVTTCLGGPRRQDSVMHGVQAVEGARWVAIHDAARPFVTVDLLERGAQVAREIGAAIAAVPVKDTIKLVPVPPLVESTLPRAHLWAAQTPQIFQWEQLSQATLTLGGRDVTDEAELLERVGLPVAVYPGSYENLKITTPDDLALARAIARQRRRKSVAS